MSELEPLIDSTLSLKNGIEMILTFVIFIQIIYLIVKIKPSPIYWSHLVFLIALFCQFTLVILYHYFTIYVFCPYIFYSVYGFTLLYGRYQLINNSVSTYKLAFSIVYNSTGLLLHFIYPANFWIPFVHIVLILIINLVYWKQFQETSIKRWFRRVNLYFLGLTGLFPIAHLVFSAENYLLFKIPYSVLFLTFLMHNLLSYLNKPRFFVRKSSFEGDLQDDQNVVLNKIRIALENDELYRQSSLSINHLSELIREPAYKISKVTNQYYGKTFPELVNCFRVADVKSRLADPNYDNYTIEALAYESGFNTPSSFYVAFKKETGMTPNQFKKALPKNKKAE